MAASSFNGVGLTTKGEQKSTPSMDSLISQLGAIASKQSTIFMSATTDERHQLQQLLRAAALALEEPFESMQRVVNSVSAHSQTTVDLLYRLEGDGLSANNRISGFSLSL